MKSVIFPVTALAFILMACSREEQIQIEAPEALASPSLFESPESDTPPPLADGVVVPVLEVTMPPEDPVDQQNEFEFIETMVKSYAAETATVPKDFDQLARAGVFGRIPQAPAGKKYVIEGTKIDDIKVRLVDR